MDTYPFVDAGALVVDDVITQRDRVLPSGFRRRTVAEDGFAACGGQANDGEKSPSRNCSELMRSAGFLAVPRAVAK